MIEFDRTIPQKEALHLMLACRRHVGRQIGGFLEIRYRPVDGSGFRSEFWHAKDSELLHQRIVELAPTADVYVGAVARTKQSGRSEACAPTRQLWIDADDPAAIEAAVNYKWPPQFVVETSPGHAQIYWDLAEALAPEHVRQANLRLAAHLGADLKACDVARILRPCGTLNHKSSPPAEVRAVYVDLPTSLPTARDLVGHLPDPPPLRAKVREIRPQQDASGDPLKNLPASEYVPALTGRPVAADGKTKCPFHGNGQERTPSLQAYADPQRGWFCFGCDEGGDIYSFASRLLGIDTRTEFPELRRRLMDALGKAAA